LGYIGTGYDGATEYKDFWEYDPTVVPDGTWTQKTDFMGAARDSAVGFSIGSKGYIGTGYDGTKECKDFWEYDSTVVPDGTWTQKADFGGNARDGAVGFSIGSLGYIGTGYDSVPTEYKDFWEYDPDPTVNKWTRKADFGGAARDSAVGFAIGSMGLGYIGTGYDGATEYKDFWEYNPSGINTVPNPFSFTDQTNAALSTVVTSNTITVSGIDQAVSISITGGAYSINGGLYTSTSGMVSDGDPVKVQLTSSGNYSTTTNATLTIGGIPAIFNVTTQAAPASSGGGCFIATAAFGSPLAGQVEILRQFRDRYLLTNNFGRKFVAWYYRNGPAAASYIKDKPLAKAAVRVALYPLIGFSFLLISGHLPFVIVGLLLSALLFFRFRPKKLSAE
jgi:N-acetylneuraminic acid mutarotase